MGNPRTLEEDFAQLDALFDKTNDVRQKLNDKLVTIVDKIDIDPQYDNPEMIQSKLAVFSTVSGILNDQDKNIATRMNLKFKQKERDDANATSAQVVDLLRRMQQERVGGQIPIIIDHETVEQKLELTFERSGQTVLDTELRYDHRDLD